MTTRATVALGLFAAAIASPLAAQSPAPPGLPPSVEVWGALSVGPGPGDGLLSSRYSPPLLRDGSFTSQADQSLTLHPGAMTGFEAGIAWFPTRVVGLRVAVSRQRADLSGANGPYHVRLDYTSQPPPDYTPTPVTVEYTRQWPDTSGSMREWDVTVAGAARWGPGRPVSGSVFAGLTWRRASGLAESLGYTTFSLGGHSVLFSDQERFAFEFGPVTKLGFNAGADLDIALGRHAALVVGYRYTGGPETLLPVRLTRLVNPDEVISQTPLPDAQLRLAPGPVALTPGGSRLVFGLKVRR